MSLISNDILQTFSSPSWVARAYSEYMLDCAQNQAKFLNAVSAAAVDEALETLVDTLSDTYATNYDVIINKAIDKMVDDGFADPLSYSIDDVQFCNAIDYVATHDSDAIAALTNLKGVSNDFSLAVTFRGPSGALKYLEGDEFIKSCDQIKTALNTSANAIIEDMGLNPNSLYTLNEGFTNAKNMILGLISSALFNTQKEITLSVKNASETSSNVSYSFDELVEQIKESYASAVAWGYGFASTGMNNLSDAIANFNSQIRSVISDTTEKFSNIVNQVRVVLATTKESVNEFFTTAFDMLGWKQVAEDTFETVDSTDIFDYTGSSPLGAINLKSAKDVATAVGKTLLAVGYGIYEGAKSLLGRLWNKAKPYVMALTADPVDIAVVDDKDDSYSCSNFKFNDSTTLWYQLSSTEGRNALHETIYNHLEGVWFAYQSYFGELCFRISSVGYTEDNVTLALGVDIQFRPSCMDYKALISYGVAYTLNGGSPAEVISFIPLSYGIDYWTQVIENCLIRPSDDYDEKELYMGFVASLCMAFSLGSTAAYEIGEDFNAKYNWKITRYKDRIYEDTWISPGSFNRLSYYVGGNSRTTPISVTNLDFIKVTCGYNNNNDNVKFNKFYFGGSESLTQQASNNYPHTIATLLGGYIAVLLYQQCDRHLDPTNYIFVPYCKGTYNFSGGRYRIKTDTENGNIASILANALVTVVVLVAAIVICKTVVKIYKAKKMARLSRIVGQMDDSMWKGKKLSTASALKYRRCKAKLNKMDQVSSGLAGAGSKLKTISDAVNKVSSVLVSSGAIDSDSNIAAGRLSALNSDIIGESGSDVKGVVRLIKGS